MIDERIYQQFAEIGRDLYEHQMISSHGGNLSIRLGDRIIIKRRGAMLGRLKPHDLPTNSGVSRLPLPSAHGDRALTVTRRDRAN